ncbi:Creatinase/aminopeptidase [Pluteus cervinus]|uniref:Creatinase/aminopeptidase n=1 Tax=Pluteus cervinus TaxID=181527 RepID=A0ACD3AU80_9AGAR|nr:Creatinase/aminopeptidase [Pluteus cervinus]
MPVDNTRYPVVVHATRTVQEVLRLLPEADRLKTQIFLLAGEATGYRNDTDRELVFRQESNFNYLSGCSVPSSFVIITAQPTQPEPLVNLYIPKAELADMMWSVPPPDIAEAQTKFAVSKIAYTSSLQDALNEIASTSTDAVYHTLPRNSPLFPVLQESYLQHLGNATITDQYLLPALHKARLIKDEYEIAEIRKANAISSRAHEVVMRLLGKAVKNAIPKGVDAGTSRPLLPGEWLIEKEAEAEAVFVASCRREGAVHQAYLPIVAAANRSSTLHYCCNDREFAWGPVKPHDHENSAHFAQGESRQLSPQVLLIDAGCEWNCYASDITRTMPVGNGGKFSPEARDIYELVLEMQQAAFEMIKAGVHWDKVHLRCHQVLVRGFQKLGIFKTPNSPGSGSWNSEQAILASGVSSAFFPHGLGHSLGMDVHDVPSASKPTINSTIPEDSEGHESLYTYLRLRLPLEEGMVVTVEPGVYFSPHLVAPVRDSRHIDPKVLKKYDSMGGVRIEDVIIIKKGGYENLTTVKSDTAWVEGICSGEL